MDVLTITDANGKNFSVDTAKICDINGDADGNISSVSDKLNNRVAKIHDVEYVNSAGETIDNMQLLKDMSEGKVSVNAIDVDIEATHSGKNHNYCVYYEDSMEKDAETFINPFRKPMLKNHNSHSEPLGRVIQTYHGPSKLTDERSAIHLKVRVTDKDSIEKFLDGRYGTVSIGGTMGTVTCNICGKTILKDGKFKFCGHWRGESYKDQICYWGAKDITYHEVSVVNTPADDYAQVMKVTVLTDNDKKEDKKEEPPMGEKSKDTNTVTSDEVKEKVFNFIDELLGNDVQNKSEDSNKTEEKTAEDENKDAEPETKDEKTSENDSEKIKKDLEDALEKIANLEKEIADAKEQIKKAEEEKTAAEDSAKEYKEKCIELATSNKELVADSIIEKEKTAEDKIEERKKELMSMSMKDLNKIKSEIKTEYSRREPAKVNNPTLASDENGNGKKTETINNTENKTIKTLDSFTQDIVSKLVK